MAIFFESPTATLKLLECHVTTYNPNAANHPPFRHLEEEVVVIKEGTIKAYVYVMVNGNAWEPGR